MFGLWITVKPIGWRLGEGNRGAQISSHRHKDHQRLGTTVDKVTRFAVPVGGCLSSPLDMPIWPSWSAVRRQRAGRKPRVKLGGSLLLLQATFRRMRWTTALISTTCDGRKRLPSTDYLWAGRKPEAAALNGLPVGWTEQRPFAGCQAQLALGGVLAWPANQVVLRGGGGWLKDVGSRFLFSW